MYTGWLETEMTITENNITLNSAILEREVTCDIFMPDEIDSTQPVSLLLLNDGQETRGLQLKETLQKLAEGQRATGESSRLTRVKYVWIEEILKELLQHLRGQHGRINLLLTTLQM